MSDEVASVYLLLNTCGGEGIVALAAEEGVRAVEVLPGRGTSEHLMPAIRRVLGGTRVGELAGIGIVVGPGSFTGVRVGLSAAKGLCEAGAVGMVALSRLELVAGAGGSDWEQAGREVVALLDAGRGEFYCGIYGSAGRVSEGLVGREEALRAMEGRAAVTCEARVAETLGGGVRVVAEPGAEEMLRAVRMRVQAGAWSDVAATDANYMRRTDAELAAELAAEKR